MKIWPRILSNIGKHGALKMTWHASKMRDKVANETLFFVLKSTSVGPMVCDSNYYLVFSNGEVDVNIFTDGYNLCLVKLESVASCKH